MMKGKIIGPAVPVLYGRGKARLAVAVELDTHVCVAALLPPSVYPAEGLQVDIQKCPSEEYFDYFIVKKE